MAKYIVSFYLVWAFYSCGEPNGKAASNTVFTKSNITHGQGTTLYKHPWQVRLGDYCGGVIIDDFYILTAAHCISKNRPRSIKIFAGGNGSLKNLEELPSVKDVFLHPDFNLSGMIIRSDIAIIEMAEPISFSDSIQMIDLPSEDFSLQELVKSIDNEVTITGWGHNENKENLEQLQEISNLSLLPLHNDKYWEDRDNSSILFEEAAGWKVVFRSYMTGGFIGVETKTQRSVCHGDSGGPMVDFKTRTLIGIASFTSDGRNCSKARTFYYNSVKAHLEWIREVTGINL